MGPKTPYCDRLHAEKYRADHEDFREAMNRVASALSDSPKHYADLREALLAMRFLPGGRIQRAAGSNKATTPYNCFVSGVIGDSFVDGKDSIMSRLHEAAATMRMGGGIGYDFSTLRPKGDLIRKLGSYTGGPLSFIRQFDSLCSCVASAGHRRGAQMGVLRIDHPDIEDFIRAKQTPPEFRSLWSHVAEVEDLDVRMELLRELQGTLPYQGFNLSVGVTDEFMECLSAGKPFGLRFPAKGPVYREIDPAYLWDLLMRSTWDWAEPGVLFIDTINRMNNLSYCEVITATNPCGEQPLPPNGACLLGSFNLTKYLEVDGKGGFYFDMDQFRYDIPVAVRAMDTVIDKATYPLDAQRKEAKSKRRMGLGITGLANTANAMGFSYGSADFLDFEVNVLNTLRTEAYTASVVLAAEKGPFQLLDKEQYLRSPFVQALPEETQEGIRRHGIRNSHLLSIAPTGTISVTADNVSSSIEPVIAHSVRRTFISSNGPEVVTLYDYGARFLDVRGDTIETVSVDSHVDVLLAASKLVDSSVSKTCNVGPGVTWGEFRHIYQRAWEGGAKGCTTFRANGKRFGVIQKHEETEAPAGESCSVDIRTGRKDCSG